MESQFVLVSELESSDEKISNPLAKYVGLKTKVSITAGQSTSDI